MIVGICGDHYATRMRMAEHLFQIAHRDGTRASIISFDEPVRHIACKYFHWQGDGENPDSSQLLNNIRTVTGRGHDPDIWQAHVRMRIKSRPDNYIVIVNDVRYQNDAETVRGLGGIIVGTPPSSTLMPDINTRFLHRHNIDTPNNLNLSPSEKTCFGEDSARLWKQMVYVYLRHLRKQG